MSNKRCISCGNYGREYVFSDDGFERRVIMCEQCASDKGVDDMEKQYLTKCKEENGKQTNDL